MRWQWQRGVPEAIVLFQVTTNLQALALHGRGRGHGRGERLAHDADLADGVGPLDAAERAPQGVVARDLHADARGGGVAIGLDDGEIVAVDAHALANPAAVLPCRVVCVHTLLDLLMSIV